MRQKREQSERSKSIDSSKSKSNTQQSKDKPTIKGRLLQLFNSKPKSKAALTDG